MVRSAFNAQKMKYTIYFFVVKVKGKVIETYILQDLLQPFVDKKQETILNVKIISYHAQTSCGKGTIRDAAFVGRVAYVVTI